MTKYNTCPRCISSGVGACDDFPLCQEARQPIEPILMPVGSENGLEEGTTYWESLFEDMDTMTRSDLRRLAWEALIRSDGPSKSANRSAITNSSLRVNLYIDSVIGECGFSLYNRKGWKL